MHSKLIAQTFGATSPVPSHVEMDDSDSSSSESGESCVPRPYIPKGKGKGRPASEVFAPISPVPYDVEMDASDSSSNESGESHVPKPPLPKGKGKGITSVTGVCASCWTALAPPSREETALIRL